MSFADAREAPGEVGARSLLRRDGFEIDEKAHRGLVAGRIAPFDLGLDLVPYGKPSPLHRLEPGAPGLFGFPLLPAPLRLALLGPEAFAFPTKGGRAGAQGACRTQPGGRLPVGPPQPAPELRRHVRVAVDHAQKQLRLFGLAHGGQHAARGIAGDDRVAGTAGPLRSRGHEIGIEREEFCKGFQRTAERTDARQRLDGIVVDAAVFDGSQPGEIEEPEVS